jgi:hypothetical protein
MPRAIVYFWKGKERSLLTQYFSNPIRMQRFSTPLL